MDRRASAGVWECPHCGARQAEAGRCWVCHRSSTCCATCVRFRASLVPGTGYCSLDRNRQPLRGDELRGCWEAPTTADASPSTGPDGDLGLTPPPDRRTVRPARTTDVPAPSGSGAVRPARGWVLVETDADRAPAR